jgi:hypothetical protein
MDDAIFLNEKLFQRVAAIYKRWIHWGWMRSRGGWWMSTTRSCARGREPVAGGQGEAEEAE